MPRLETRYLNLTLRNPIIIASSGLTKSLPKIQECERAGAGAVILKSLFEEVLAKEDWGIAASENLHPEAYDYLRAQLELQYGPRDYCELISEAKKKVKIPVIASINCIGSKWWASYAKQIEASGADALELNVFTTATHPEQTSEAVERLYYDIADSIRSQVKIPIAIKLGMYFTALPHLALELSRRGVNGLVLFNRFTELDIDIDKLQLATTFHFSSSAEMKWPLRWTAILADQIGCDLAATTGIHNTSDIIKLLLAGASAVQMASVFYYNGLEKLPYLLTDLENWMEKHHFESVDQFKGLLSYAKTKTPDLYLRWQFLDKIRGVE